MFEIVSAQILNCLVNLIPWLPVLKTWMMPRIFRDSFQNVVELLDDLFQRAASAEGEPSEMNFIKKHSASMRAQVRIGEDERGIESIKA